MLFRAATEADAASVAALHTASWRAAYRAELPATYLDTIDVEARAFRWRDIIARPEVRVIVAELDGSVAGFAAFGPSRDPDRERGVWQLYNLHVSPERWAAGLGSALWARMVEATRASGARELTLWVVTSNERARRFYERKGLLPDGANKREPLAPTVGLDEVRYRGPVPDVD